MHDLRDAWRALVSTPVVTAAAVLTLALGIGANTAIFSILDSLLLRPLPVRDPSGLVAVGSETSGEDVDLTYDAWRALDDRRLLDGAFAWTGDGLSEVEGGESRPVRVIWASDRFFETLGLRPAIGTAFEGRRQTAVISAAFWRRRFGDTPDVVGRTIVLDRVPFTIAGVTPPAFFGFAVGTTFDVILPLDSEPLLGRVPSRRNSWPWLHIVGRIPAGRTVASVAAAVRAAQPAIRTQTMPYTSPEDRDAYLKEPWTLRPAATGSSGLRTRYATALTTLMGIAAMVLLIGCANIANLQLARAAARRYERSVRAALGASRWRLIRPVLIENLLLAAAGTAIGLAFAQRAGTLLVAQLATWASAPVLDLSPDVRVLAVSAGLMIATVLLFGVTPTVASAHSTPVDALARTPSRATSGRGFGEVLIATQIAVCVVLVVGAALFIRTFAALAYRDLGFDRRAVVVAAINAQRSSVPPANRLALFERMREEAAAQPGVEAVAISMATPLGNAGVRFGSRVSVNASDVRSAVAPRILTIPISPGWFRTYGTQFRAGRDFTDGDTAGAAPVAIVNDAFARRFFGGQPPLGRTFATTRPGASAEDVISPQIVGVVEDAAFTNMRKAVEPMVYVPLAQTVSEHLMTAVPDICLNVRAATGVAPEHLRRVIAPAVARVDPNLAIATVTVGAQLDAYYVRERLLGLIAGFFAVLGLSLAAIGLYGVTAHSVTGRRRELAVRIALGAEAHRISRLVFRRLAIVTTIGIAVGAFAALLAGRLVENMLFGVTARDPFAFASAAVTLVAVSFAAAWFPARRAARTEPMIVLREP